MALTSIRETDDLLQAVLFHGRERRRSLAGIPELFRTHQIYNAARVLTLTGATNATPIVVTSVAHGLVDGQTVTITGVTGNTAANGTWLVTVVTADTFSLDTSIGNGVYGTGGTIDVTAAMPVPLIGVAASFPARDTLITFRSAIRIHSLGSVASEHRGLVFELGSSATGVALWVGDQTIGFRAGGTAGDDALALFDNSVEFADDIEMELVAAINPGLGKVRLWGNGQELARAISTNNTLGVNGWAAASDGSFAALPDGTIPADVPAVSQIAPDGFDVIEPLSVYVGSTPRHFEA